MEFSEYEGKTIDQAIQKACETLNVPREKLNIEIMCEGTSGFFGLGSKKARIKAAFLNFDTESIGNRFEMFDDKDEVEAAILRDDPSELIFVVLSAALYAEDVEWAKSSYNEYANAFSAKNLFWQYAPMIASGIFVAFVIVMIYMLLQKFDVLSQVASSLTEVSKNLLALKNSAVASNAPL